MFRAFLLSLYLAATAACSSIGIENYSTYAPALQPEVFFSGYLTAHGVVKDRSGLVTRTFNADIDASWENGVGTLVEDFIFGDGETQRRVWTLSPRGQGIFTATAGDVIGPGEMTVAGNSAFLDYVLRIPYSDSTIDVSVTDRMYLVAPDILIGESHLSKFGVHVGRIDLVIIQRHAPADHH